MPVLQFNYPTTIIYGPGAALELAQRIARRATSGDERQLLLVTDRA
jgi:hypothetical protein